MSKTKSRPPEPPPPAPRRRFRLMQAALGGSERGATVLGYALALAAALMFINSIGGVAKPPRPGAVMNGDRGGPPSE